MRSSVFDCVQVFSTVYNCVVFTSLYRTVWYALLRCVSSPVRVCTSAQKVYTSAFECVKLCTSVFECVQVLSSVFDCVRVHPSVFECVQVCLSAYKLLDCVQVFSKRFRLCTSVFECVRVFSSVFECF